MNREGYWAAVKHYFHGKMWLLFVLSPLIAITGIMYLGVFIQALKWLLRKKIWLFFMFLAFVEYYLILPGPVTMPRYQLPALPMMCVMAAMAFKWLWDIIREKTQT